MQRFHQFCSSTVPLYTLLQWARRQLSSSSFKILVPLVECLFCILYVYLGCAGSSFRLKLNYLSKKKRVQPTSHSGHLDLCLRLYSLLLSSNILIVLLLFFFFWECLKCAIVYRVFSLSYISLHHIKRKIYLAINHCYNTNTHTCISTLTNCICLLHESDMCTH